MNKEQIKKEIEKMTFCSNCNSAKSLCNCGFEGYKYAVWASVIKDYILNEIDNIEKEKQEQVDKLDSQFKHTLNNEPLLSTERRITKKLYEIFKEIFKTTHNPAYTNSNKSKEVKNG